VEALQVFLETPGDLASNMRWSGMLPASASVLEGAGKFSMQLIGRESRVRQQGWGWAVQVLLGDKCIRLPVTCRSTCVLSVTSSQTM
jgi:hypothetical protein